MSNVALLLTVQQKDAINGQSFCPDSLFNPVQDLNDNWIISLPCVDCCTNETFVWVKTLPQITFNEKPFVRP